MKFSVEYCGKLKDPGLQAWISRYTQRSRSLIPIELRLHRNMQRLRESLSGPVILLDERGESLSSMQLAQRCQKEQGAGRSQLRFMVGAAEGFDDEDRAKASWLFSLSALTLPHRIAQLLLVEQLYRVGTILAGHPYHNEG